MTYAWWNPSSKGRRTSERATGPPLFHTAKQGHVEVVRRLLRFDTIDVNQQFWNRTPLCVASEMGHLKVIRLLLEHTTPPDINLKTNRGNPALPWPPPGHLAIINLLLEENRLDDCC